jgi:SAM-dependent methyltransferase
MPHKDSRRESQRPGRHSGAKTSLYAYNSDAWDREAARKVRWSRPASRVQMAKARKNGPDIILTPDTPVPAAWLESGKSGDILCLGGGGGQQAPLLATIGRVVSADASKRQLDLDLLVAKREGLDLRTVKTDMADLSALANESFDLIVNPCSSCFVRDMRPVWKECHRVLRRGGTLISGHLNPAYFLFDHDRRGRNPAVEYSLPYSDEKSLPKKALAAKVRRGEPLEVSHSLTDLIGGQLDAGLLVTGFLEDTWTETASPLAKHMPLYVIIRAIKP